MENKKWFIGLEAREIEKIVKTSAYNIAYSVNFDNTLDEIEDAYDRLCQYENSLADLFEKIVDIKTSLYSYNTERFNEWDNCLMEIRGKIFEYKDQIGNMYMTLNREKKAL